MKRRERLAARRVRGLSRPAPVDTVTVNLASVSARPEKVKTILAAVLSDLPALVFAVECSDVTVANLVSRGQWQVVQFGRTISDEGERLARSGSALIARRDVCTLDRPRLTLAAPAGEGIRDRYIVTARARFHTHTPYRWSRWVHVGHAPPARAPWGRERFLTALHRVTGVRAGDFNIPAETARRRFAASKVLSAGVLHLVVPRWIPTGPVHRRDVGSDHSALQVTLWPSRGGGSR